MIITITILNLLRQQFVISAVALVGTAAIEVRFRAG